MSLRGIHLAHDASACQVGVRSASFSVREAAPADQPPTCVPGAGGRAFALLPIERVAACRDTAGIDDRDLDTVTFCDDVAWTATEARAC